MPQEHRISFHARHQQSSGKSALTRVLALGLGLLVAGVSAQAANVTDIYQTAAAGVDWSAAMWSTGAPPVSNNDALFTTGSAASSLITAENFQIGSFNSTIAETVTNGSATASFLTLGGGSATTDQIPGSNPADLIFINSLPTAVTNLGTTGTGALNIVLGQNGRISATSGTLNIGSATLNSGGPTTLDTGGFTLTYNSVLTAPNITNLTTTSVISGAGSIIKTGTGQCSLAAANTFTGGVTVERGSLNPSNATSLGAGTSAVALGDAVSITNNFSPVLFVSGNTTLTRNFTVGASNAATTGFYTLGSGNASSAAHINGTTTLNQNLFVTTSGGLFYLGDTNTSGSAITSGSVGTQTVTFNGAGPQYIGAVVGGGTGTIGVTKASAGTAYLTAANTYTGTTTVNQGALQLTGSLTNSPALAVGGGTFAYNPGTFSNTAGLAGATAPTFTAATGSTQTMNGTTINAGGSFITATAGNTLNLGAVGRSGNGIVSFTPTGTITTTSTGANGILGPYAYTGTGANLRYVTPGTIAAYAGGTAAVDATGVTDTTGTVNYDLAAGGAIASGTSANTLRYTGTAAATITGGPLTLNGLMNASSTANTLLTVSSPVTIGSTRELVILSNATTNAASVTLNGVVSNNGGNASALTFGGPNAGTLLLTANNTYTGGTTVNGGTLAFAGSNAGASVALGTVTVNNSSVLNLTGNDALGSVAGSSVTTVNVNLGGTVNSTAAAASTQGLLTSFNLTGGTVNTTNAVPYQFNVAPGSGPVAGITSNASTAVSTFTAPIVIRNTGNLTFNVASGVIGQDVRTASDLTVTGVISQTGGTGGISKTGTGILTLTAANTYAGGTFVSAGTLVAGGLPAVGGAFTGAGTLGTGNVTLTGTAALTLNSTGTTMAIASGATLFFAGTTTITLNNATADTLTSVADTDNGAPVIAPGTYTAAQLDAAFGVNSFTGAGSLTVTTMFVPEPSTWVGLVLAGGVGGFALRRRVVARPA